MRILFISACYLPTPNGVTYHIQLLKQEMERRGHKVYVLAPKTHGYVDSENNILRFPSVSSLLFPNYPLGLPIYSLKKIKEIKPDIVHTHHPFLVSQLAVQIAKTFNLPLFFTSHTRYEEYFHHYLPALSQPFRSILVSHLRHLASNCQKIICPSPLAEEIMKSYGIENTQVVYNGIDTSNFIPSLHKKSRPLKLIFVGRVGREKNINFLLQIAIALKKTLPDFRLMIVGEGREFNHIQHEINNRDLSQNIHLTGLLPRNELIGHYQSAHAFISPSMTEVMPLTFIEALSSGLPVICLNNSGVNSFLPQDKSVISLFPNAEFIANRITGLFRNNQFHKLSPQARKLGQRFDISISAGQIENLYRWQTGQK